MRLLRLRIENYRNFERVECGLGPHVVLLGENGVGKTNLLRALRLVLDPSLPDSERYLEAEDFWIGTTPFGGTEIIVSVDLTDYSSEPAVLACLGDHEVEPPDGHDEPVARLTFRYAPRPTIAEDALGTTTKDDYEFAIFGRDEPANEIRRDVRRFLVFKLLHALRDVEGDLRTWKRSPLRPLLERLIPNLDATALVETGESINEATASIVDQPSVSDLDLRIKERMDEMIGEEHRLLPKLGFASTDPKLLLRSLKLFVDAERRWEVSETSLGLANVVYLALLLLHVRGQEDADELAAVLLGIEEPEAHLHPQMQRQVFRDLLRGDRAVLVSTHSPNIASVAPVESLVVLRSDGQRSSLFSFADSTNFSDQQREDISRYLDVTRGEILFGRGIILVEGEAEEFIVPAAARLLDPPIELDDYGISVCSVGGTDFIPYTKFLQHLGIPCVVLTDGDARDAMMKDVRPGAARMVRVLKALGHPAATNVALKLKAGQRKAALSTLRKNGLFVGRRTLELDILAEGAGERMAAAFKELRPKSKDSTLAPFVDSDEVDDELEETIIGLLGRPGVGKGRFSQRFVAHMELSDVPSYVRMAIKSIVKQCKYGE